VYSIVVVCSWLALTACSTDEPLSPARSEIVELDAALIEPSDSADLEDEGHDIVVLDHLPDVGPPEESIVADADVPESVLQEIRGRQIDKAIVGKDSRAAIRDTKVAPYNAVAQVLVQWLKGEDAIPCTGTMVAPDAVLTAAHCVYNSARTLTGFPYSVSVVPGLYPKSPLPIGGTQYNAPFGVGYAKKLFVPDRFKATERNTWNRIPFDYAVARLKTPLAKAGVRSIGVREQLISQTTVLDAYHEDKQDCLRMHESKDIVRKLIDDGSFNHFTDLKPGSSGGGIVGTGEWANKVFGIQSSHIDKVANPYNIAATITADKYRVISSWVSRAL
jgi:V8-like Glu-specific endopeptidase